MFLLHLMTFQSFYWISQGFIGVHGVAPEIVSFFLVFFFFYRVLPWLPTIRRRIRFPGLYFFFFFWLSCPGSGSRERDGAEKSFGTGREEKKKNIERKPNQTHTHTHKRRPPLRRNKKKSNGRIKIRRTSQRWRQNLMGLFGEKKRKRKKKQNKKEVGTRWRDLCLFRIVDSLIFFYVVISSFFFHGQHLTSFVLGLSETGRRILFQVDWNAFLRFVFLSFSFYLPILFLFPKEETEFVRIVCYGKKKNVVHRRRNLVFLLFFCLQIAMASNYEIQFSFSWRFLCFILEEVDHRACYFPLSAISKSLVEKKNPKQFENWRFFFQQKWFTSRRHEDFNCRYRVIEFRVFYNSTFFSVTTEKVNWRWFSKSFSSILTSS